MHLMAHLVLGIALLLVGHAGPSAAGKPADADVAAIRMRKELGLSLKLEVPAGGLHVSLAHIPPPKSSHPPNLPNPLN